MPEGDTLEKIAHYLKSRLVGKTIISGRMRDDAQQLLAGQRVVAVQAHGKHLFIRFRSGWGIRTHLGMTGSWHRYAIGEKWQRPAQQAALILQLSNDVYVCFNAKEVQALTDGGVHQRSLLQRLGPDLSDAHCDLQQVLQRARQRRESHCIIVDALLDQSIAAGIGNVYKSEVLFIERIAPRTTLGQLTDTVLGDLYARACELIRGNLGAGPRRTRPPSAQLLSHDERLWVYRRSGRPCARCSTPIRRARLGEHARSTYWCESCQAPPKLRE